MLIKQKVFYTIQLLPRVCTMIKHYKENKLNSKYSWRIQHLPYNYTENKFQLEVLINVV